jgi:hypothetical protein
MLYGQAVRAPTTRMVNMTSEIKRILAFAWVDRSRERRNNAKISERFPTLRARDSRSS